MVAMMVVMASAAAKEELETWRVRVSVIIVVGAVAPDAPTMTVPAMAVAMSNPCDVLQHRVRIRGGLLRRCGYAQWRCLERPRAHGYSGSPGDCEQAILEAHRVSPRGWAGFCAVGQISSPLAPPRCWHTNAHAVNRFLAVIMLRRDHPFSSGATRLPSPPHLVSGAPSLRGHQSALHRVDRDSAGVATRRGPHPCCSSDDLVRGLGKQGTRLPRCSFTHQRLLKMKGTIMATSTVHPNHQLISSEDVEGTNVYDTKGSKIGEIDHLMIDKVSGRVTYAVMSFGGFLGLGHSHYPIPWAALKYDTGLNGYVTGITEQQLKDAPAFSDDSWSDRSWETQTYKHYNVAPYW
jgi:sporulation protein YlmC with PRC-barrel domain